MNAKQVAEALSISTQSVYLQKTRLGGRKHRDGGLVFDAQLVEAARKQRGKLALRGIAEGHIASEVFAGLEKNESLVSLVVRLEIPPDRVRALAAEHASMKGGLRLEESHLQAIYAMPLLGIVPALTAEAFVELLRGSLAPIGVCAHCKRHPAQLCKYCVRPAAQSGSSPR